MPAPHDGSSSVREQAALALSALWSSGTSDAAIARAITRAWRGASLDGPEATFDDIRRLAWLLGVWLPEKDARWLVDLAVFIELAASDEGSMDLALLDIDDDALVPAAADATEFSRVWSLTGDALAAELAAGRARVSARTGLLDQTAREVAGTRVGLVPQVPGLPGPGADGELARSYFEALDADDRLELATLLTQADTELRNKGYRAAMQAYSTAIARAPDFYAPRVLRASILVDAGYLKEAAADIARAGQLTPTSPSMLQVAARIHLAHGEGESALAALDSALALDSTSAQILGERGFVRLQLGLPSGAAADFAAAALREPDKSEHHFYLGTARLQEGDTSGALDAFDRALELRPDAVEYLESRGTARSQLADGNGARADFERVIALSPLSTKARLKRAVVLMELLDQPADAYAEAFVADALERVASKPDEGDLDQANGLIHDAGVDADPGSIHEALIGTTMATFERLLARGALKPGFALLDALDQRLPETKARTQTLRGLAHERSGNRGEAISAYRKALGADPRHWLRGSNSCAWCGRSRTPQPPPTWLARGCGFSRMQRRFMRRVGSRLGNRGVHRRRSSR